MAQVVDHWSNKLKALSSNPSIAKKKKERKKINLQKRAGYYIKEYSSTEEWRRGKEGIKHTMK
jgi:hypothetical protein